MRKKAVALTEAEPAIEPESAPSGPGGAAVVKLDANLDLTKAAQLSKALLAARGSDITVDASEVHHLGAQCGQILVSARSTWRADGHLLSIVESSAEFIEGARLLGLEAALKDEDARS